MILYIFSQKHFFTFLQIRALFRYSLSPYRWDTLYIHPVKCFARYYCFQMSHILSVLGTIQQWLTPLSSFLTSAWNFGTISLFFLAINYLGITIVKLLLEIRSQVVLEYRSTMELDSVSCAWKQFYTNLFISTKPLFALIYVDFYLFRYTTPHHAFCCCVVGYLEPE